jgi:hypothetical protein
MDSQVHAFEDLAAFYGHVQILDHQFSRHRLSSFSFVAGSR